MPAEAAIGVSADITNQDDVERAVAEVRAAFGPPLIVIGQTKFNIPGDFSDISDYEHYVESFRSYTMSQVYLLRRGAARNAERRNGVATCTSARRPRRSQRAPYTTSIANATRPSTIGLLKTVADEYAQFGVTVNTVAPGWIATQNAYDYLEKQVGITNDEQRRDWMIQHAGFPRGVWVTHARSPR